MDYSPSRRTVLTSSGVVAAGFAGCLSGSQADPVPEETAVNPDHVEASGPDPVPLGTARNYTILAQSGISTVPDSDVAGNIGVSPIDSTAITGFGLELDPSGQYATSDQVDGQVYAADFADPTPSLLTQAVSDMQSAYTDAAGRQPDVSELADGVVGGQTIGPGTYFWSTDVLIDDDITLEGGPDDTWIFQIEGDLTMASDTNVVLSGGARPENIVWQVGGGAGATIGTNSTFAGIILSATGINVLTGATVDGCLYAQTDVNLQMATVTGCESLALSVETDPATDVDDSSATLHGELTDLGEFGEGTVYFEYREVTTEDWIATDSQTLTGPGSFSTEIDGLEPGTEYEFRAVVEANGERDHGDILPFITSEPGEPSVETQSPTDVNGSSATLHGNLTDLGNYSAVDVSFEWREVGETAWIATDPQTLTATDSFSDEIVGLEPGTDYEFRAVATADGVTVVGGTLPLTKPDPDDVAVQTLPATDVNGSTATLHGTVSDLGGFSDVDVNLEWREVGETAWNATDPQTRTTVGSFSDEIEGLEPGTDYEYRAVVSANDETVVGNTVPFPKLEPGTLTVLTQLATDVNGSSATLHANLMDLGGHEAIDVHFEWREVGETAWNATDAQTLTATGSFTGEIVDLEIGTEYEFRAVAVANDEEVFGATLLAIKDEPDDPIVRTERATDVNGSTATLNAELEDFGGNEAADVHFEWREAGEAKWTATGVQTLTGTGSFSDEIAGLEPGTEYWFRAVAQVNEERILGATLAFTKLVPGELAVETKPATDVNGSSATLNGVLTERGGFKRVSVFFQYRVEGTDGWMVTDATTRTKLGLFSATATNLEVGTDYEFQAVAQADGALAYGELRRFTKTPDDRKDKKRRKGKWHKKDEKGEYDRKKCAEHKKRADVEYETD